MAERTINEKSPDMHLESLKTDVRPDDPIITDREVKEKALLRRIDKRMMPLMMLICGRPHRFARTRLTPHRCPELPRPQQYRHGTSRQL
jgi:hypothetical protein